MIFISEVTVVSRNTRSKKTSKAALKLPDVSAWQPRKDAIADLEVSYRRRCQFVEKKLLLRATEEQAANIDSFDSGIGIEEIFRDELANLLPARYEVTTGVVSDRFGATAGHCDCVIFNNLWFPVIKAGATVQSRRKHLPVEGAYGVIEVKQSLDLKTLDGAMEKLVVFQRLHRPPVSRNRYVENREGNPCAHAISNPLYSAVFALGLGARTDFQDLIQRFAEINKMLKRREMVTSLVVLGEGIVSWVYETEEEGFQAARFFYEDLYRPIRPVWTPVSQEGETFYRFLMHLNSHLFDCVLGAEDIAALYGERIPAEVPVKIADDRWEVGADAELVEFLRNPCGENDWVQSGLADYAWNPFE
jgi:hypothetical protein